MSAGSLLHASVGAYRLVDFLGAGGMGEVYRGVHVNLGRVVAVKVLSSPGQAGSLLERFKNEAQIQATLQHPNVVALYDFLELGGRPCIVMEYVDGQTIDAKVRREGPIDPAEAIGLFESIAGAVGYLHNRGIVHRDLKPGNIKISESNCVKLLDFGLAKGAGTPKLTATGMVVGTLEYMAPEQLAQQPADERTDIWALGVVLYEMVTGRLPFQSTSVGDLLRRIAQAEYFPASTVNPAVPRQFDGIIAACLKQNPDHRLRSVDRLLAQVRPIAARLRRESLPEGPVREVGTSPRSRLAALVTGFVTSPQTRLAAILLASFAILASIGVAIARDPSPGPGPFPVPAPVPAPTTRSEAAVACGLASSTDRSERIREVTIDVPSGWAKVRCGAAELGRTPLVVRVEIGKTVGLTLVRDGFADERIEFAPTSNTRSIQIPMRSLADTLPAPIKGAFLFAWLPFFKRRRDPGARAMSSLKATNADGAAAVGGTARIAISVLSDLGCVRDSNEDAIGSCAPIDLVDRERTGVLLVVADGMGGHSAGEVASRLAVETVIENYAVDNADPGAALIRAVKLANHKIHQSARADRQRAGMGTTCTALVIRQGLAYCAHVGDSRLYLVRDGAALQMTEDHSAVYDLVKRGVIDREVARVHPDRNVIVRALGSRPEVEVAGWPQPLLVRAGDRFLISSDGLHDLVSDEEIAAEIQGASPEAACHELIRLARTRGGHDNISAGILAIASDIPTLETAISGPVEEAAT